MIGKKYRIDNGKLSISHCVELRIVELVMASFHREFEVFLLSSCAESSHKFAWLCFQASAVVKKTCCSVPKVFELP